jgi:hypothetical protein
MNQSRHLQGLEEVQGASFDQDILVVATITPKNNNLKWWSLH